MKFPSSSQVSMGIIVLYFVLLKPLKLLQVPVDNGVGQEAKLLPPLSYFQVSIVFTESCILSFMCFSYNVELARV